jgi:hypothetical protein
VQWTKFLEVCGEENEEEEQLLKDCRRLTNTIYDGLDLRVEIMSVIRQRLGDIVLISDPQSNTDAFDANNDNSTKNLAGFAICHCGGGTEAGSNTCYIKFAAVRPSTSGADPLFAARNFDRLIDACTSFASQQGLSRLVAGVNTSRQQAYEKMLSKRFRIDMLGVAMENGNDAGYNKSGVYILDDWR